MTGLMIKYTIPERTAGKGAGRLRRKWLALACSVLLVVQMTVPAAAVDTIYFTAVNNEIMDVDDATMPFWSGGYLYVPSTVFRDLGVGHSRNSTKGILTLYDLNDRINNLIFNLNDGTVTDGRGNGYYPPAIQRGSVVFLPAVLVAEIFNLNYNGAIRVKWGFLVRVSNSSATLSDATLADAAGSTLEERYNKYIRSQTQETDTQPSTGDPALPQFDGKRVYLCMAVTDPAAAAALLDDLDRYSGQAAFYFPPELLESSGDLLRRMAATGQAAGILVDASRTDLTVSGQIARGNEALWRAAYGKSRLVYLENGTDAALAEVREAGCRALTPELDRSPYGLKSASAANTLLDRVSARRGDVTVWLGSAVDSAGLRTFLAVARNADDRCLALTETA